MFPVVTGLVMKEISTECGPRMELGVSAGLLGEPVTKLAGEGQVRKQ